MDQEIAALFDVLADPESPVVDFQDPRVDRNLISYILQTAINCGAMMPWTIRALSNVYSEAYRPLWFDAVHSCVKHWWNDTDAVRYTADWSIHQERPLETFRRAIALMRFLSIAEKAEVFGLYSVLPGNWPGSRFSMYGLVQQPDFPSIVRSVQDVTDDVLVMCFDVGFMCFNVGLRVSSSNPSDMIARLTPGHDVFRTIAASYHQLGGPGKKLYDTDELPVSLRVKGGLIDLNKKLTPEEGEELLEYLDEDRNDDERRQELRWFQEYCPDVLRFYLHYVKTQDRPFFTELRNLFTRRRPERHIKRRKMNN